MAIHSSILAWRIPWTEKPGRLQSMGLQRAGLDLVTKCISPFLKFFSSINASWGLLQTLGVLLADFAVYQNFKLFFFLKEVLLQVCPFCTFTWCFGTKQRNIAFLVAFDQILDQFDPEFQPLFFQNIYCFIHCICFYRLSQLYIILDF